MTTLPISSSSFLIDGSNDFNDILICFDPLQQVTAGQESIVFSHANGDSSSADLSFPPPPGMLKARRSSVSGSSSTPASSSVRRATLTPASSNIRLSDTSVTYDSTPTAAAPVSASSTRLISIDDSLSHSGGGGVGGDTSLSPKLIKKQSAAAVVVDDLDEFYTSSYVMFALVPLTGDYSIRFSIQVLCQDYSGNTFVEVRAPISDTFRSFLMNVVSAAFDGNKSNREEDIEQEFQLRTWRTDCALEVTSHNRSLGHYRAIVDAVRHSQTPIKLCLVKRTGRKPNGEATNRSSVPPLPPVMPPSQLSRESKLRQLLKDICDVLEGIAVPGSNRLSLSVLRPKLSELVKLLEALQACLNLHSFPSLVKLISHFQRLSQSMLVQDIEVLCRRTAETVIEIVNAYASAFGSSFRLLQTNQPTRRSTPLISPVGLSICIHSIHRLPSSQFKSVASHIIAECSLFEYGFGIPRVLSKVNFTFEHISKTDASMTLLAGEADFQQLLQLAETCPASARILLRLYAMSGDIGVESAGGAGAGGRSGARLIAFANISPFLADGQLRSGLHVIPLWPSSVYNHRENLQALCTCVNGDEPSCMCLVATFQSLPINFSNSVPNPPLNAEVVKAEKWISEHGLLDKSMEEGGGITPEEIAAIWLFRNEFRLFPATLPFVLLAGSVLGVTLSELNKVVVSFDKHLPNDVRSILRLLLPSFGGSRFTCDLLCNLLLSSSGCDDATLSLCLPQFIAAIRWLPFEFGSALIARVAGNFELSTYLFWLLHYEANNSETTCCRRRYDLLSQLLKDYRLGTSSRSKLVWEISKQQLVVMGIVETTVAVHYSAKDDRKLELDKRIVTDLQMSIPPDDFSLPVSPESRLSGLEMRPNYCAVFPSKAAPLRLAFQRAGRVGTSQAAAAVSSDLIPPLTCIVKAGDDLRRDALALQLTRLLDFQWLSNGLDLKVITYRILPISPQPATSGDLNTSALPVGFIEFVPESDTLRVAQSRPGGLLEYFSASSPRSIYSTISGRPTGAANQLDPQLVDTFARSLAAWCVASYVLGVGDRHDDNILVCQRTGHLFHIDFGRLFGSVEKFAGVSRDQVPFIFTKSMAAVLTAVTGPDLLDQFRKTCCYAFNLLRQGASLLMCAATTLGISAADREYLRQRMLLGLNDEAASTAFYRLIDDSLNSVIPQLNFWFHDQMQKLAQQAPPLPQDQQRQSSDDSVMTPLSSTAAVATSPRPSAINAKSITGNQLMAMSRPPIVTAVIKRKDSKVKVYLYKISLKLVCMPNDDDIAIFRSYADALALRDALFKEFPEGKQGLELPQLKFAGKREVKDVAMKRLSEMRDFVEALTTLAQEIKSFEPVIAFFRVNESDIALAGDYVSAAVAAAVASTDSTVVPSSIAGGDAGNGANNQHESVVPDQRISTDSSVLTVPLFSNSERNTRIWLSLRLRPRLGLEVVANRIRNIDRAVADSCQVKLALELIVSRKLGAYNAAIYPAVFSKSLSSDLAAPGSSSPFFNQTFIFGNDCCLLPTADEVASDYSVELVATLYAYPMSNTAAFAASSNNNGARQFTVGSVRIDLGSHFDFSSPETWGLVSVDRDWKLEIISSEINQQPTAT